LGIEGCQLLEGNLLENHYTAGAGGCRKTESEFGRNKEENREGRIGRGGRAKRTRPGERRGERKSQVMANERRERSGVRCNRLFGGVFQIQR
jgi:hypothetical protein